MQYIETKQALEMLFPRTYRLTSHQSDDVASNLFRQIMRKLQDKNSSFQKRISPSQMTSLNQGLDLAADFSTIYYCEYSCAIILYKAEVFAPIQVTLIFPKEWDFTSYINNEQVIYIADDPKSFASIQVGQVDKQDNDMLKVRSKLMQAIQTVLEEQKPIKKGKKDKDRKNHHTPTFLLQVAKVALQRAFEENPIAQTEEDKKTKEKEKQKEIYSKGGTLDVGIHTGTTIPNTVLPVVVSCLEYIFQNKRLVKLIMFFYKLYTIKEAVKNASTFQLQKFKKYDECVCEIICSFKDLVNEQVKFDEEFVAKQIQDINNLMKKMQKHTAPPKITVNELVSSVANDEEILFKFKEVRKYDSANNAVNQQQGSLGFSRSLSDINGFRNLLEKKGLFPQNYWIMMVQNYFFSYAIERLGSQNVLVSTSIEEIKCNQKMVSKMHEIIIEYGNIIKDKEKGRSLGMKLTNQSYSHYYLLRLIGAVIAFEVVKRERKNTKANLEQYKCPQTVITLYKNFYSLSYEARMALDAMLKYCQRNSHKKGLFVLEETNRSYYNFVLLVAEQNNEINKWKDTAKRQLEQKIKNTNFQMQRFKTKYEKYKSDKTVQQLKSCTCFYQEVYTNYHKNRKEKVLKQCQKCRYLANINSYIKNCEGQTSGYIVAAYAEHEIDLFGFFNKIPSDILGLMKIFYESQIPIEKQDRTYEKNFFGTDYCELIMHTAEVKNGKFNLVLNCIKSAQEFINYPSKEIKVYYKGHREAEKSPYTLAAPEKYEPMYFQNSHQYMLNSPSLIASSREHETYSKINLKKKSEYIDEYITFGSIRVTNNTELLLLSEKLKCRHILIKFLIQNQNLSLDAEKQLFMKALIILNSAACVQSFKPYREGQLTVFLIVEQCIIDMLKNYTNKWKYEDMYFLHIIGIVFSMFSKLFKVEKYALEVAHTAFKDYEKHAKQNSNGDNTIKSQLAYFLHGTFSLFNQDLTENLNKHSIELWVKIQFLYRINKVFSDQNLKDKRFRETMEFFEHYRERAIMNNIENVLSYFQDTPQPLTEIIKMIDFGISAETKWRHNPDKGEYVFSGQSEGRKYDINLFSGIILKNGAEVAGLPENIKKNDTYIQIFGKNRDLQVYPENDGSLRTRTDFSSFFPNEPNSLIFFEFKIDKANVIIRMIIKRKKQELKYVLIPESVLEKSNIQLPELYVKLCFAWYCFQENLIAFRSKPLEEMRNIGLILLLKRIELSELKVVEARIVENHLKLEPISFLKNENNSDIFDLLIFSQKNGKKSKAISMIYSIEVAPYILQISSPDRTLKNGKRLTKFWLHRYNLTFTLSTDKGLLSDNFQGYAIADQYNSNQHLPWRIDDQVKCMILHKIDVNLRFAKNHNAMVLVPNTVIINQGVKNAVPHGANRAMKIFSYELHDYFHDLRAKKILDQLHLAGLTAVCYSPNLMMTNLQYAVSLLRSCESIKPLTKEEQQKLENVLINAMKLNQYPLILICVAIFQATRLLQNILPYQKKKKDSQQTKSNFLVRKEIIQNCKMAYRSQFARQQISTRLQLTPLELKILRLSNYEDLHVDFKKQESRWDIKYKSVLVIPENYDECLKRWCSNIEKSYQLKKEMMANKALTENNQNNSSSRLNVLELEENCTMSLQQKTQLNSSLDSYENIKKKLINLSITKEQKNTYLQQLTEIKSTLKESSVEILSMIIKIQTQQNSRLQFLSKQRPLIKEIDFTFTLCNEDYLNLFYPNTGQEVVNSFRKIVKLWMELNIEYNSIQRMEEILKDEELDKINLLREIESPREQISKNLPWIAFEMQMKTQIWLAQYETFMLLNSSKCGVVTQLNMGEGKTQIIIPLIVLNQIYNKKIQIPRVNILTPLFHEAQENYFKFLSITGFKLHLLPLCFNREVSINSSSVNRLQYAIDLFQNNSLILIDRDSSLSLILKTREEYGFKKNRIYLGLKLNEHCHKKDRWIFRNLRVLDIFDEVDALMTPKKSFVYAVGNATQLPHSRIRFQYTYLFLDIIIKRLLKHLLDNQMAVLEECYEHAISHVLDGRYPKGFRFLSKIPECKIKEFRFKLVNLFLSDYTPPEFQFIKILTPQEKQNLIQYCINQKQTSSKIPKKLTRIVYEQIYIVRGILAYGIIEHCLTLRNGVDYGAPGKDNLKRVGVPYQAADMPSKRSEYSHPEVATILSYMSYYNKGLSFAQFEEALHCLVRQTDSSKQRNYDLWIKCIEREEIRPSSAKTADQINVESIFQKEELYRSFQFCRATVTFWLIHCVFPTDLAQYTKSITSSSWDLADSKNCIGFSGTKDTHWLFPEYLYLKQSTNDQINGTDGKMVQLMLENTLDVLPIKQNQEDLWKKFCETALQLKVGCIIDVGAILAGKSLEMEIVPWISNHPLFKKLYFKGITYCTEGVWKVFDTATHSTIARETSIPEHETFVIFDQARTRGADIKMKTETIAALSIGPIMTKDRLMQAVGRLRKFGRNQQIYLLSSLENFSKIEGLDLKNSIAQQKTKKILEWVCRNSINQNKKMMYPNSKLAWIHFNNTKCKQQLVVQEFNPSLKEMYESDIKYDSIQHLNQEMAYAHIEKYGDCQLVIYLQQTIQRYGDNHTVKCQSLQDICEREIEMIEESQRQTQVQAAFLEAIAESGGINYFKEQISTIDIRLNNSLLFSTNFINCTKSKYHQSKVKEMDNELCVIHFVLIRPTNRQMVVVTQRQAGGKINQGVKCLGPERVNEVINEEFIVRFEDLSIKSLCIWENRLEKALTDAHFFNGRENFEDRQLIYETIHENYRWLGSTIERIVCHFLERRRSVEDKYMCSHLESVYKQIISSQ